MNFQQLEYILAVERHKNFGKAAESCHITQATLSAMIKKLEQELNLILFDRSRQPIQTTEAGKQVIALAREALYAQDKILQLSKQDKVQLSGKLRMGIIPTVANSLLPIILPRILNENPEIQLEIKEITTEEIKNELLLDQIDFGILATPLEDDLFEENILFYEAMMVYGSKAVKKKYVHTDDIKNEKIWLLEEGNCFRNQSLTVCNIREKSDAPDNLRFAGSSFETLLNLTDRFGGFTLVPELYYQQMSEEKKQKTHHFELPMPVREISVVYHRPQTKKNSIEYITDLIKEMVEHQLSTKKYKASEMEIIGI